MIPRTTSKKISFGFAIACLLCSAASLVLFVYFLNGKGVRDVLSASTLATTIFFACCATVLYFMSKPPRYELHPWDEEEKKEESV